MNYNDNKLEIGTTYLTPEGVSVTPIKQLESDRALFVSDNFYPTPFIAWTYSVLQNNEILLYRGDYYTTLDRALNDIGSSNSDPEPPKPIRLLVSFYCPDCEYLHYQEFSCDNVQHLAEQIEDYRVHCPGCDYTFMGIHSVRIADDDTEYDLPMWKGPVPDDLI